MAEIDNHYNDVNKDPEIMEMVKIIFITAAEKLTEILKLEWITVKDDNSLVVYDQKIGTYARTLYAHELVWSNKDLLKQCLSDAERDNRRVLHR